MPRNQYSKMTKKQVISLFKKGIYSVDLETGVVLDRYHRPLSPQSNENFGKGTGHYYNKLYYTDETGRYATNLYVHQIVWMFGTLHVIPYKWEIHHLKEEHEVPYWNAFSNLICLHKIDHLKFHKTEDVPF